jgi:hypothetical protein
MSAALKLYTTRFYSIEISLEFAYRRKKLAKSTCRQKKTEKNYQILHVVKNVY